MSGFDIAFVEDEDDDEERAGAIVIGDFEEGFLAPTEFWDADDYRAQWLEAAQRFVEGADRTCFVTVAEEDFIEWWKVYRHGPKAVFHNQHRHLDASFDFERLYESIPDYAAGPSEWSIEAAALERFVRTHGD